jgi:uracil-DNA glycosylase family 4
MKSERLQSLKSVCELCHNCSLGKTRIKLVFGEGGTDPKFMSVAEAPGRDEDTSGRPFVGRSGQLYRKLLNAIGLDPEKDVYMANILKCRPPNNRVPEQGEIDCCIKFLQKQIEIVSPKLLLFLGKTAVKGLLPEHAKQSINSLRSDSKLGKFSYQGIPVIITYHPSALLMDPSKKPCAIEDFAYLKSIAL